MAPQPYMQLTHPEWTRDAAIYQLNLRQFTEAGTFDAARQELPRIAKLGARIIWLMPIHEIGEQNRKGTLGSPYSVKDYYSVNPEFGSEEDLRQFIAAAHDLGLYVIFDWVANHTAWDNSLAAKHPDWYERRWDGSFMPTPWWDWSDIIDLNFDQPALRVYMRDAMAYWVREFDIDGFRCDVAGYVPIDFWESVRRELDAIKPVFMLAEWESRDLHARAFDASYAWSWYNAVHDVAQGKEDTGALFGYYSANESAWPHDALRMTFVSNHDKNSWEGTQFEAFGDALPAAIALSVVGEGMPLIYNGQEAGNPKRLEFFERDPIRWQPHPIGDLYAQLFALKRAEAALWNGVHGARMIPVTNSAPREVLSFVRSKGDSTLLAVFNFSPTAQTITFSDAPYPGDYADVFSGDSIDVNDAASMSLAPWAFRVMRRQR
ncbi:MAG: alpha-amylase family glycosyl hydrolase [Pseudomonadota bacterium]